MVLEGDQPGSGHQQDFDFQQVWTEKASKP